VDLARARKTPAKSSDAQGPPTEREAMELVRGHIRSGITEEELPTLSC
jgi:hypothetical protein